MIAVDNIIIKVKDVMKVTPVISISLEAPEEEEPDVFVQKNYFPSARASFRKKVALEIFDFD